MTATAELKGRDAKSQLPDGWRRVTLGEVCEFLDSRRIPINDSERTRRIADKKQSELFPYYGANGQVGWIDDYLFDEPLILLAEDGGNFGSAERPIAYAVSGRYWVNNHAHVLKPRVELIDFDYCLESIRIRPDVAQLVSGSTRAKLNQEVAASIPVPLPPLSEQKRIAGILKEQMAAVERARCSAEAQLHAAEALPAAHLRTVFSSPEAQSWQKRKLGEICDILAGFAWASGGFSDKGLPVIRIQNLGENDRPQFVYWSGSYDERYLVQNGDLLISLSGTVPVSFKAEIWSRGPALLNQRIVRLRQKNGSVSLEWLARNVTFQLESIFGKAAGSTGIANVKMGVIETLDVPLPSPNDQERLVVQLSSQMSSAERLRQTLAEQLDAINQLPAALLRRAFSGEL